jgi:hypothetical protein
MPSPEHSFQPRELYAADNKTGGLPRQSQGSEAKAETASRSVDRITQINRSLDSLWQKYEKDGSYRTVERENGQNLLKQLNVSPEAMTVIKACAILDDIILEQMPKDALNLPDVIPSITQAISQIRADTLEKQLDLKTELVTVHTFLETLGASDQEVYADEPEGRLDATFYDKTFHDLLNSVNSATKYF